MLHSQRARWALVVGIVVVALAGLGVAAFQPWTANHFGYALPGPHGLPFRIHYGGRDFGAPGMCAGADWCQDPTRGNSTCLSPAAAQHLGWWPLDQVGTLYTLFGPSYLVLGIHEATQMLLFVQLNTDCYIVYSLEGGP